jgi:hypothetical protein
MVIENFWCAYGYPSPEHIGKVAKESENFVIITRNERGSLADSETWEAKYARRFNTIEEAVDYLCSNIPAYDVRSDPVTEDDIRRRARNNFPSEYE